MKKPKNLEELEKWRQLWNKENLDFKACADFWDGRASSFNQGNQEAGKAKKVQDFIESLRTRGIVFKEASILDIGCGPGTHAVPLAAISKEVIAADISENMLACASDRADQLGYGNLKAMKTNWAEVDLSTMGWEKYFDLVIASMSPAVNNFNTLEKMCLASKGWCYMTAWVKRSSLIEDALTNLLFPDRPQKPYGGDKIYYAFNILWNMGYCPELSYNERSWENSFTLEEAKDSFTKKIMVSNQLDTEQKKAIEEYLDKVAENGIITEKSQAITGALLWQV